MTTRKKTQARTDAPVQSDPAGMARSEGFMNLDLDLIDEDPHQPRTESNPGYSQEGIEELGTTIKSRGVKSPISVRVNPDEPGRYLINHGARRYRASKWAGKTSIPAFIDNDYNETDQVIENLQRENLTAREIADFIGRELSKGKRAVEIAQAIGKSKAFVSQHTALLDLPDPIAEVFNGGRARDVTTINELLRVYRKSPAEVIHWLDDPEQIITRETVGDLKDFIEEKYGAAKSTGTKAPGAMRKPAQQSREWGDLEANKDASWSTRYAARLDHSPMRKSHVMVMHEGRRARLMLMRRPSAEGRAWLKYDDDGNEADVDLKEVRLIAVLEG